MDQYVSPFVERYSSKEMLRLFSPAEKFRTWRRLWVALARAQKKLGLKITDEQIKELEANIGNIDFQRAAEYEKKLRHEVMAHIRTYGDACPRARGIIHLGATSAYVTDNTDVVLTRDALLLIKRELVNLLEALKAQALKWKDTPQVAYTHFQPAQLTTVGKRISLWMNDFVQDVREIDFAISGLRFLGCKGAVGTQSSYLELFDGDEEKVRRLEELVAKEFGLEPVRVSGQTYSRKVDARVVAALSGVAVSLHKMSNDMRLMQHLGEVREPFEEEQVGSSAMPYKQNPVKAERIASLCRHAIACYQGVATMAAGQWLERTLDDSAIKRIAVPEAFFAVDASLVLAIDIARRLNVSEPTIRRNVERHFPFIATENILMAAVKLGGDRQELHEVIRRNAVEVTARIQEGKENDLIQRLKADGIFRKALELNPGLLDVKKYVGRASAQVKEFIQREVDPVLRANRRLIGMQAEVRV